MTSRPPTLQDRLGAAARVGEPGKPSPAGLAFLRWVVSPYARVYFRPRAVGLENLPEGPCLIVANHSGGGVADVLSFATLWFERFEGKRPTTGLAHPVAFWVPGIAWVLRSFGAVPSTYEHARAAFASGASVLVFPGGDHEGFRPIWQANRVDWNGRQGFLKIARESWVPVVPLGYRGAHYTAPILWRSRALAWLLVLPRLLGIKRVPVSLLQLEGLAAILVLAPPAWGWAWTAVLAYLWSIFPIAWQWPTIPWPVRLHVGKPIPPEELFGSRESTTPLDASAERVRAAVQSLVSGP